MIRDEFKQIDASDKAVYGFARLMAIVGLLVAAYFLYKTRSVTHAGVLFSVGAAGLVWALGTWTPTVLRPLFKAWMLLAVILGFVMTRVILFLVFALVVTPTGLIMRSLGRDPLKKHPDATLPTYWISKDRSEWRGLTPSERFKRLF